MLVLIDCAFGCILSRKTGPMYVHFSICYAKVASPHKGASLGACLAELGCDIYFLEEALSGGTQESGVSALGSKCTRMNSLNEIRYEYIYLKMFFL